LLSKYLALLRRKMLIFQSLYATPPGRACDPGRFGEDNLQWASALAAAIRRLGGRGRARRDGGKPLKKRARQFVTVLVAATAVAGFAAWYKIDKDSLEESFGTFRELFRYVSFHAR
jgi:hypothetical protein